MSSSEYGPRPVGVRLELPGGESIPLDLVPGPLDGCGCRIWMAYGPSGMVVPFGADVEYDDLPDGSGLAVAFEQNGDTGEVRFACKPILPVVPPDSLDVPAPPPGQGWN